MLVVDIALGFAGSAYFKPYTSANLFIEARFYFGWAMGLVLAPAPYRPANPSRQ